MNGIGVVAAAAVEAMPLRVSRARAGRPIRLPHGGWLKLSGIGRNRAARAAEELLEAGARALVSWGVAGGLDPRLMAGIVVVPDMVITGNGGIVHVDVQWRAQTLKRLRGCVALATGALVESSRVLGTAGEKLALGESCGAVATDMESAAVAEVARDAGTPFLAIRAILDTAQKALPFCATRALDINGEVALARLGTALLVRPREIVPLIGTAISLRRAQAALTTVARILELR